MRPGEVVYLVDDDLPDSAIPAEQAPVSDEVVQTTTDWMSQLVRSVTAAGLAKTAALPVIGIPDPEPTPSESTVAP